MQSSESSESSESYELSDENLYEGLEMFGFSDNNIMLEQHITKYSNIISQYVGDTESYIFNINIKLQQYTFDELLDLMREITQRISYDPLQNFNDEIRIIRSKLMRSPNNIIEEFDSYMKNLYNHSSKAILIF